MSSFDNGLLCAFYQVQGGSKKRKEAVKANSMK